MLDGNVTMLTYPGNDHLRFLSSIMALLGYPKSGTLTYYTRIINSRSIILHTYSVGY